jgi:hypothetical protein
MHKLIFSPDVLPRVVETGPIVAEFTRILEAGAPDGTEMGYPVVIQDQREQLWVADGVKRLAAMKRLGITHPWVHLRSGSKADAIWYAAGANTQHGVRLSASSKRQAAELCLRNPAIRDHFTARVIAHQVGLGPEVVGLMASTAAEREPPDDWEPPDPGAYRAVVPYGVNRTT